jgi:NAD(P)-dependent dehydrogenase (short-subunit alcohol dehydrogenase family)
MADLTGTALVVGGASGVGAACAEALRAEGQRVVIGDLRQIDVSASGYAGSVEFDVRDRDAVRAAIAAITDEHGPLTSLVHAAGTARVTPFLEISPREWDLIVGVNLHGAFHVLQAGAEAMSAGGAIVVISSVDAQSPVAGLGHYCAAKAGLESLVRSAALELGPRNIRVNAVAPGVVRTPLMESQLAKPEVEQAFLDRIPLGRIAMPADIAGVVAFLTSSTGAWITGTTVIVDGGMKLREHPQLLEIPTHPNTEENMRP